MVTMHDMMTDGDRDNLSSVIDDDAFYLQMMPKREGEIERKDGNFNIIELKIKLEHYADTDTTLILIE